MPKKILVVEDDEDIKKLLKSILLSEGFKVILAEEGIEAINKTYNENPDLIVLDILLPEMDGYQVCRLLKNDKKYQHIPIIMLTAKSHFWDRFRGMHTGADRYIIKSEAGFSLLDIVDIIKEMLGENLIDQQKSGEDRRKGRDDRRQTKEDRRRKTEVAE
ncbi:MAG: response regulator [bacterium]